MDKCDYEKEEQRKQEFKKKLNLVLDEGLHLMKSLNKEDKSTLESDYLSMDRDLKIMQSNYPEYCSDIEFSSTISSLVKDMVVIRRNINN
jgi:hypothetical protein